MAEDLLLRDDVVSRFSSIIEMYFQRMGDLLEQSERRIDNTNEMIKSLAATQKQLTETYAQHFHELVSNRDEILMQNKELLTQNKKLMELLDRAQQMDYQRAHEHMELLRIIGSFTGNGRNTIFNVDNKAQTI